MTGNGVFTMNPRVWDLENDSAIHTAYLKLPQIPQITLRSHAHSTANVIPDAGDCKGVNVRYKRTAKLYPYAHSCILNLL